MMSCLMFIITKILSMYLVFNTSLKSENLLKNDSRCKPYNNKQKCEPKQIKLKHFKFVYINGVTVENDNFIVYENADYIITLISSIFTILSNIN